MHCISYHHPTKDLAILHLNDEINQIAHIESLGGTLYEAFATKEDVSDPKKEFQFYGHNLIGKISSADEDTRRPVPNFISGHFHSRSGMKKTMLLRSYCYLNRCLY